MQQLGMNNRRLQTLVLLGCLFAGLAALAQPQRQGAMSVLYDPKSKASAPKLEPKLLAQIIKDLRSIPALKDMRTDANCVQGPETSALPSPPVTGVAVGAFTKDKANQTAYLVEPCTGPIQGDAFATVVAVYEAGKLVTAVSLRSVFPFTRLVEAYGVKDVDRNGLSELALVTHGGDGCGTWTYLDLIQWVRQTPSSLGSLAVAFGGCDDNAEYTVYVNKSPKPTFVGAEFGRDLKLTLLELQKPNVTLQQLR